MGTITLPAKLEFLYEAISFVHKFAWENKFYLKEDFDPIELSIEEVFSNTAAYAYPDSDGLVQIDCRMEDDSLVIEFTDAGIAYNPLDKPDPDIDLPAKLRPIGGLGIYFVKNFMDFVEYERKENKNILTLKKQKENSV